MSMTNVERKKAAAWEFAKLLVVKGSDTTFPPFGNDIIATIALGISAELDSRGCFADIYGDDGSFEVSIVKRFLIRESAITVYDTSDAAHWVEKVFSIVREMISHGALTDQELAVSRVFAIDEAKRKADAEAEKERERIRREKEQEAKIAKQKRVAEIKSRMTEIKKEKGGAA